MFEGIDQALAELLRGQSLILLVASTMVGAAIAILPGIAAPTMMVRLAALAPTSPPDTGASR